MDVHGQDVPFCFAALFRQLESSHIFNASEPNLLLHVIIPLFIRPIAGCIPTYPEKINPNLRTDIKDFDDFWMYEQDGPLLEVC